VKDSIKLISILLLACLFGLWLRFSKISEGLPYFYNEDEAHHFNRVVEMAKNFEFNPHYFHKPSLHFYLRMPAVWGAYLYLKERGQVKSMHEFITRDPYGKADYAFSASHPTLAKFNRAFSVLISLGVIFTAGLIAFEVFGTIGMAAATALLCAVSPALIDYSAVIGVDLLMALMVLVSVYFGLRYARFKKLKFLVLCSIFAGLAVSSKYNAAPIGLLPVFLAIFEKPRAWKFIFFSPLLSLLAFIAASPFILVEFKSFMEQAGYEVWHYAVAGHEGHMANPGIEQVVFYAKWFANSAVGSLTLLLSVFGLLAFIRRFSLNFLALILFPLLYFVMMIFQKANFERNMLVEIPFLIIFALSPVSYLLSRSKMAKTIGAVLLSCMFLQPLMPLLALSSIAPPPPDSRVAAEKWLRANSKSLTQTAVSGELQFEPLLYKEKGFKRVKQASVFPFDLYLLGFDRFVVGPGDLADKAQLSDLVKVKSFEGASQIERIVVNPQVDIYEFPSDQDFYAKLKAFSQKRSSDSISLNIKGEGCRRGNQEHRGAETYCWTTRRLDSLRLMGFEGLLLNLSDGDEIPVDLSLMSPWENQSLKISAADWSSEIKLEDSRVGDFYDYKIKIPLKVFNAEQVFELSTAKVLSPKLLGQNADKRTLGIAIRSIRLSRN